MSVNLIEDAKFQAEIDMGHEMGETKGSHSNQYSMCDHCLSVVLMDHGHISGSALDTPCKSMANNELPGDMS